MPEIPQGINHTVTAIYDALAAKNHSGDSAGVPMSDCANECERAIWYKFRWACEPEKIDGQKARKFGTGLREEERLLDDLEAAGVKVWRIDPDTGRQYRAELANGWLRGKIDGFAEGIPEAPKTVHVVETKSHNDRSFKDLVKKRLREAKPAHYAQCQLYMLAEGLTRCLYLAVNKNDDNLYAERVEFDSAFALTLEGRIKRIVSSDRAPSKLYEDPKAKGAFACSWCPALNQCHEGAFARVNCRTCLAAEFRDGASVWCTKHEKELSYDEQQKGCSDHRFLPDLVPGEQIDANPEKEIITYRLLNGAIWVDGASTDA